MGKRKNLKAWFFFYLPTVARKIKLLWHEMLFSFINLARKNLKIGQPSNIDVLKEGGIRLFNRKNRKYPDFSQDNKNILTSRIFGK